MERKRVLMIIPELSMGGAQRSFCNLSLELARAHQVTIVVFNHERPVAYPYAGDLNSLDVGGGRGVAAKLRQFVRRVARLRRLKRRVRPDVSISFLEGADYVNILSSLGERVIVSVRGSKVHDQNISERFPTLRHRFMIPFFYRRADAIVTVNHGIARELRKHYGLGKVKIITIGNFYDVAAIGRLSSGPRAPGLESVYADPVLVTTGRLAPEKGLDQIIRIFGLLKRSGVRARLVIVGDGPLLDRLVALCNELALRAADQANLKPDTDVVFVRNQPEVFMYVAGAAIYLMNSSSEGFPNGMAEAMALSVPVISADCPYGPRELLAPDFEYDQPVSQPHVADGGILMPLIRSDADLQTWADTIAAALSNPAMLYRFGEAARSRISAFDVASIIPMWDALISEPRRFML